MLRLLSCLTAIAAVSVFPSAIAQARPSATPVGNDISYPQCGRTYPSGQAFAIVGVNGGKASNFNSCFASEWAWAKTSKGGTNQPLAQLYINTGNPGDVLSQYNVTDWPTSSVGADPYGSCVGTWQDDLPCSWEYGYERASADMNVVNSYQPYQGRWWLDIETANSWTSDFAKNQASLEGMVYALQQAGNTVGIYSSSGSWSSLFGTVDSASSLYRLDEWRPGARTLSKAQGNCALAPFEGNGRIAMTQYVSNNLDDDYSCV
jgi:hypothetical protein